MGYYKEHRDFQAYKELRAREQYGGSLKNYRVAIQSSNATSGHISGEKYHLKRHMHPYVHRSTVYNSQDLEDIGLPCSSKGLFCSSNGKEFPCNAGDQGSFPGLGRSSGEGNGNPLQYSCLENPRDRGAWQATVNGVAKSQT